jgi:hypothetical protein
VRKIQRAGRSRVTNAGFRIAVFEKVGVSAVITNFNRWSLTERCVRALEQYAAGYLTEIIVVDDFSDNGRSKVCPQVVHYSRECQKPAMKEANEGTGTSRSEFVLLLDSDAEPISNLPALVAQD